MKLKTKMAILFVTIIFVLISAESLPKSVVRLYETGIVVPDKIPVLLDINVAFTVEFDIDVILYKSK